MVENLKVIREIQKEEQEQVQPSYLHKEKKHFRNKIEKMLDKIIDSSGSDSD